MEWNKALLIHHLHAGKANRENTLGLVTGVLAPAIHELVVVRTDEPGEGEKLCWERGEEFDVVFILGGDGTVHECVNGLASLQNPPQIGVLPGGTCNDFARSLGISRMRRQQHKRCCQVELSRWMSDEQMIGCLRTFSE